MGTSVPADVPTTTNGEAVPSANAPAFRWKRELDDLFNRELWSYYAPYAVGFVACALAVGLLMALTIRSIGWMILLVLVPGMALVFVIILAAPWVRRLLLGRRPPTEFEVGPAGVRRGGSLKGTESPGSPAIAEVVGAGIDVLGALDTDRFYSPYARPPGSPTTSVAWRDISGVVYDARRHVITLKLPNSRRLWLYCGLEEWERVVAWVRWGTPIAAKVREADGTGRGSEAGR